jgi:predicted transcriptional regulator of viral defense system
MSTKHIQQSYRVRMADSTKILEVLRERVVGEEFDHQALVDAAREYARPRDLITRLLRAGSVVRVAPGIYIFGPAYRRRQYSLEILANLIAGPSYVSLDYALQHHALIPERVEAVTSSIAGRPRRFETPVGLFIYRPVPERAFAEGLHRIEVAGGGGYLIAGAEKALADKIRDERGLGIRNIDQMLAHLLESLRIDAEGLAGLDPGEVERISAVYGSYRLGLLAAAIRRLRKERRHE